MSAYHQKNEGYAFLLRYIDISIAPVTCGLSRRQDQAIKNDNTRHVVICDLAVAANNSNKSDHLLSAYYVPGTALYPLPSLSHFQSLKKNFMRHNYYSQLTIEKTEA